MCIIFCLSSWSRSYHRALCYSFYGSCRRKLKFDKRSMISTWAVRKIHWIDNQSCVGAFEAYFCVAMSLTSLGGCIWSFLVGCINHMEGIWSYHSSTDISCNYDGGNAHSSVGWRQHWLMKVCNDGFNKVIGDENDKMAPPLSVSISPSP